MTNDAIQLPPPVLDSKTSLETALRRRRSQRRFADTDMTLAQAGQLLWAAQGLTSPRGFRTTPSAGALFPLTLDLVVGRVMALPSGIYRYRPQQHRLQPRVNGDRRDMLCQAALGQTSIRQAPAVLVIGAVYPRMTAKYGERGISYVHMECGAAAQNICLQAAASGVAAVILGAFRDAAVKSAMALPETEDPLVIVPVGYHRQPAAATHFLSILFSMGGKESG